MSSIFTDGVTNLNKATFDQLELVARKGAANGYAGLDAGGKVPLAQLALISYGTTLPASPSDGQEAILVDSVTNPSYQWRFRYNAGSTSAYKWEFIGGSPAIAQVVTSQSAAAPTNVYFDLPTLGPSFVVPRAGDYGLAIRIDTNGASAGVGASVMNGGGTAPLGGPGATGVTGGWGLTIVSGNRLALAVAAATELRIRYIQSAASINFTERVLAVTPVRLS